MSTYAGPYPTSGYPSEVVWTVVHALATPDRNDPATGDGLLAYRLAQRVAEHLGVHDSTTPVQDLLPLAVWAVLNGAPKDLATFAADNDDDALVSLLLT